MNVRIWVIEYLADEWYPFEFRFYRSSARNRLRDLRKSYPGPVRYRIRPYVRVEAKARKR